MNDGEENVEALHKSLDDWVEGIDRVWFVWDLGLRWPIVVKVFKTEEGAAHYAATGPNHKYLRVEERELLP